MDHHHHQYYTFTALAYPVPGIFTGKERNPLMKVSKFFNISEASGSSGLMLNSCFIIVLSANCMNHKKEKKKKKDER